MVLMICNNDDDEADEADDCIIRILLCANATVYYNIESVCITWCRQTE